MFSSLKPSHAGYFFCFFLLLIISACSRTEPQEPDPVRRKSPIAIAKVKYPPTDTYIKIVYGQPYKRGRAIFGDLVPYDQVWRTGANEATEMTTTKAILFAGKKLAAGTYALFSIPHEGDSLTIILNSDLGQWGAFEYNEDADVMRVEVPAFESNTTTEVLSIQFSEIEVDSTNILLNWDQTKAKIPVIFLGSE